MCVSSNFARVGSRFSIRFSPLRDRLKWKKRDVTFLAIATSQCMICKDEAERWRPASLIQARPMVALGLGDGRPERSLFMFMVDLDVRERNGSASPADHFAAIRVDGLAGDVGGVLSREEDVAGSNFLGLSCAA